MIGKLSELLVSGYFGGVSDIATTSSPRSQLNLKMQSPRGLKNYNHGGVGLGIVASLDKSCDGGCEILEKHSISIPKSWNRSNPIPVIYVKNDDGFFRGGVNGESDMGSMESYTYVTCHKPGKSFTKVYYDGVDGITATHGGVFEKSPSPPARFSDFNKPDYPSSSFLSSCHLCRKSLDGKDIYMYRGEKGFCSTECRSRQIMKDERKEGEGCGSEASRAGDHISASTYNYNNKNRANIFSTGILAM